MSTAKLEGNVSPPGSFTDLPDCTCDTLLVIKMLGGL